MSDPTPRIDDLSPDAKRQLLSDLLSKNAKVRNSNLTAAQQRLWFLSRLAPQNPFYIMNAFEIIGRLDLATLDLALVDVLNRHDALRMSFREIDGRPVAVVARSVQLTIPVVDIREDELENYL